MIEFYDDETDNKEEYFIYHYSSTVSDINDILEIINPEKTKDIEAFNVMKSYLENEIKLFKS